MLKVKGDWILAESHHALWGRLTFASPYIDPPTHQRIWIDFSSSDPIESVTLPQTARECATHTHNKQAESNFTAWHDLSSMLLLPTQNEWVCLPTSPIIIYLFFPRRGKCLRMRSRCSRGRARRACGASMCVSGLTLMVWVLPCAHVCHSYFSWPDATCTPLWNCDRNK